MTVSELDDVRRRFAFAPVLPRARGRKTSRSCPPLRGAASGRQLACYRITNGAGAWADVLMFGPHPSWIGGRRKRAENPGVVATGDGCAGRAGNTRST